MTLGDGSLVTLVVKISYRLSQALLVIWLKYFNALLNAVYIRSICWRVAIS